MSNIIKVVSLFSGCGGLDLGFMGGFKFKGKEYKKTRYSIVFSNDIDINAEETYNENIKFFDGHKMTRKNIIEIKNEEIPYYDILLAGFPCQPFSSAGKREGVLDKNGRGTLFYECYRVLEAQRKKSGMLPKAFLFENVRGITTSKTEDGCSIPEEIEKKMKSIGYNVYMKLIKCSDYGVPQNRYRYIIIGIRNDLEEFNFDFLDEVVKEFSIPTSKSNYQKLTLGNILCDIPTESPNYNDYWKYSPQGQKMIDMIGPCIDGKESLELFKNGTPLLNISPTISVGKSWKNIEPSLLPDRFKKIHDNPKKYRAPNFYRRFALGEIAGTITAAAQPEHCGITHPFENRRFTVREIARIQSFPDNFRFPMKAIPNSYKVIGNAVPPIFAWVLAKSLERIL